MALFTPKHYPWTPTKGYEEIDAYSVYPLPVTSQRTLPCYIPKHMLTTPLKFPNLVHGFNSSPIHAARTALSTRYDASKWLQNHKSHMEEVSKTLSTVQPIVENLENLVREQKKNLSRSVTEKEQKEKDGLLSSLKPKVNELSGALERLIKENDNLQDCKRKLQASIQGIGAPLQIAQECLRLREARSKSELVNDNVEQLLMKEVESFRQSQKDLQRHMEEFETQLKQGRNMQNILEKFLKGFQWIVIVERSIQDLKRISESKSYMEDFQCLIKKSELVISSSENYRKQIGVTINEVMQNIVKTWKETNDALLAHCTQMKKAIEEVECAMHKIKNEIFNVGKNLKYLKTNKGIFNELQQGQDFLESLLRTKKNLKSELSSKKKSLFDDKKCMTIRNCYPISITTVH